MAFSIIKYVGACYLIYLAYKAFRNAGTVIDVGNQLKPSKSSWNAFKEGILIDVLNPKVAIFFMALLPQFVREGYGSASVQLFYLGVLIIVVAIIVETGYVIMSSSIARAVKTNSNVSKWLDRMVGTMFVFLGVKLATSTNN